MITSVRFLEAGFCRHPEKGVNPKSGHFRNVRFPASVAVVEHSKAGVILFDTGYSPRFYDVTRRFPEKLYALVTPVHIEPETTALAQIEKMGIRPDDVRHVILSHFHADHVGGVADFTRARYLYSSEELRSFRALSRFGQVKSGFLNALLPTDLEARAHPLNSILTQGTVAIPELGEGWFGTDLFGDESLLLVPLPGHTAGQLGLFIRGPGAPYFLVADAAWLKSSFEENVTPMRLAQMIFHDRAEYARTLSRLHEVHQKRPEIQIVPCHCETTLASLVHREEPPHV